MTIKQFEYKPLSHFSYAVVSDGKMAVIDPERDASMYINYAATIGASIQAIIETHPHADFVSSHLELHRKTGATIYNSSQLGAAYTHQSYDHGDQIKLGTVTLTSLETPGHSPDSITIVAQEGTFTALFTGDTLFIGDVGRPDLREKAGNMKAKRQELAAMMYETMTTRFNHLPDDALVYPAHGAGSLCGKNLSDAASSTLGDERSSNWAFKKQSKEDFVASILDGQPFVPAYFAHDVEMNKNGAPDLEVAIKNTAFAKATPAQGLVVDIRAESQFKASHIAGSINIQAVSDTAKFETWLGAIIQPEETFSLVVTDKNEVHHMLNRIAKIGYESLVNHVVTLPDTGLSQTPTLDLEHFKNNLNAYTIVDIRNASEIKEGKFFEKALAHPLNELRKTAAQIPTDRPIVVHCAGGYRSAAGSSIIQGLLKNAVVYDLSDAVKDFQ
jgi:glyoxylase-like metal-dependent hydrolase (beta-lactamase superfamily II)/rhodanese-related sulfurtransferase